MGLIFNWNGKPSVPDALPHGHDQARAERVRAAMESGRVANAAKGVARLCLAHIENKQRSGEFAERAYNLRIHKRDEVEVTYPAVVLIGLSCRRNAQVRRLSA